MTERALFSKDPVLLRCHGGFRTEYGLGHTASAPRGFWGTLVGSPCQDLAYSSLWTVPQGSYACFFAPYARIKYDFWQKWRFKVYEYSMGYGYNLYDPEEAAFPHRFVTYPLPSYFQSDSQPSARVKEYIERLKEELEFPDKIPFEYVYPFKYMAESLWSVDTVLLWWLADVLYAPPTSVYSYGEVGREATMFCGAIDNERGIISCFPFCPYHPMCFYVFTKDGIPICGLPAGTFSTYVQSELSSFSRALVGSFPDQIDWSVINDYGSVDYVKRSDRMPLKTFKYNSNLVRWSGTFIDKDCVAYPLESSKNLGTWFEYSYSSGSSSRQPMTLDDILLDLSMGDACPGQILEVHAKSEDLLVGLFTTHGGVAYGMEGLATKPQVPRYREVMCDRPMVERQRASRAPATNLIDERGQADFDTRGNLIRRVTNQSVRYRFV